MKNKKRIVLVLSAVSTMVLAGVAAVIATKSKSSISSRAGDGTGWRHYSAVAPTCASFGIKEYWTDCNGNTTIEDPHQEATEYTTSQEDIARIISAYGESDERILAKSDTHGAYEADPNCLGKEVCSVCHEDARGVVPSIDFQTNGIYGMYDWYKAFGAPDAGWVSVVDAGTIQFLSYNPGYYSEICLPRIYYGGFTSVSIDLSITYSGVNISLEEDQSVKYTTTGNGFTGKLEFSNISSSSLTVKLLDSSSNVLLTKTVNSSDVINAIDGFKFHVEGVYTGVGYETLSNFSFVL